MSAFGPPKRAYDFLLSRLQEFTKGRYEDAIEELEEWLGPDTESFWSLGEEEQDFILSDFIMELRDREDKAPQAGSTLVAAVAKRFLNRRRYAAAHLVTAEWRKEEPPQSAPAMPEEVAFACTTLLWAAGLKAEAIAVLLCFCGLLRIGEALGLKSEDVVVQAAPHGAVVLLLRKTKTVAADIERVVLSHPVLVEVIALYAKGVAAGMRFLPTSYRSVSLALQAATAAFGFDLKYFRTHSLRRGGATALLLQGHSMIDIMHMGRWASEKSCRLYLKAGSVICLRLREGPYRWGRIRALAGLVLAVVSD